MRKFLIILLIILIIPTSAGAGALIASYTPVQILVDGQAINTQVYAINGRNYASAADVAKAMGGIAEWDGKNVQIETQKADLERIAPECKKSCVLIIVLNNGQPVSQGSGFVYGNHIITAKHVLDGGNAYRVHFDGEIYGVSAARKNIDNLGYDIGVLSLRNRMPSVKLGDSDKIRVGQKVFGITSPNGNMNTIDECITNGITKYLDGNFLGLNDTIMTTGSSGGAIFNYDGEVIGLECKGNEGGMSAIPINEIKNIIENLE